MNFSKQNTGVQSPWAYAKPAMILHWLLALLLAGMVSLGWYMMSIEDDPGSDRYFNLHKSVGITVLVLVGLRLLWRLRHKPEALPSFVPAWQSRLASGTQRLLYLCMFALPITGLTGALYSKDGVVFLGITLPHPAPNHDFSEQMFSIHGAAAWVLIVLVGLHVAGGLKHLLLDRDGVFQRMWPGTR